MISNTSFILSVLRLLKQSAPVKTHHASRLLIDYAFVFVGTDIAHCRVKRNQDEFHFKT